MRAVSTIPVTIEPDAQTFIDEVGQQHEFERILDHAQQTIPALCELVVKLHDYPETGPPSILIDAYRAPLSTGFDMADRDFGDWMLATFPPQILQNFTLLSVYNNGR